MRIFAAISGTTGEPAIMFQELWKQFTTGSVFFLGLLCVVAFAANAVLLAWLLLKRGASEIARCPKCGRMIICPHCSEASEPPDQSV